MADRAVKRVCVCYMADSCNLENRNCYTVVHYTNLAIKQ